MTKPSSTQRLATAAMHLLSRSVRGHESNERVALAIGAIDHARVSSAASIIAGLRSKIGTINGDAELSDHGKRERVRAASASALGNVAALAKKIVTAERQHAEARRHAVSIPKADPSETLIDLALAAHIKQANLKKSDLLAQSERVRAAVARVPGELSGLTPETHARVTETLMPVHTARELAAEHEALSHARAIVQAAIDEVAADAQWGAKEMVGNFGADWRLPGIAQTQAERMAAGGPENAWEALETE